MTALPGITRSDALRNRARLLDAAAALVSERGPEVDVREIAGRADVGMGTLYRHFATKQALLDAALEHAFATWADAAEAAMTGDPWADLCGFLDDALARHASHPGLLDAYSSDAVDRCDGDDPGHRMLRPLVTELVRRAQDSGVLRPDVTVEDISLLLVALGRIVPLVTGTARRRTLQLVLDGLRAPAATSSHVPAQS